jgi:glucosamine kinase
MHHAAVTPQSAIVAGVDAGGTHTIAAVAQGTDVLQTFESRAANPQLRNIGASVDTIAHAVEMALDGRRADALAVGLAGAGRQSTRDAVLIELVHRFPDTRVAVTDDAHIALRGAIPNGNGMVLIAGTGSIAYAEIDGRRLRAGGYGYAIGDEGSGHAIGSAALQLLLRSYEKRIPSDALCEALAEHLGRASTVNEVLTAVYESDAPVATVAACARIVIELASTGERNATKIVQAAALALYNLVRTLVALSENAESRTLASRANALAFAGGLLRTNSLLTYLIETRIANELPHVAIVKGGEPYIGALADARALLA